jgi:peptidoglycan/LPS O-acetylase OafA/YrhL
MKRTFAIVLGAVAAAAVFAGLVHTVLVAAHVSEPAETTVYGLTPRRLWATAAAMLALVGVVIGGVALTRPVSRLRRAILALGVGLLAAVNGGLNLAVASGGPGTGNGVVGGAVAFVLGMIAIAIGWVALTRSRRSAVELGRTT